MSDLRGHEAARDDMARVMLYKDTLVSEAKRWGHNPAILAAILSRETHGNPLWCKIPADGGTLGDNGHGHGPMQIDDRTFPEFCAAWRKNELTTEHGIVFGAAVLASKRLEVRLRYLDFCTPLDALRRAVAAYNVGIVSVWRMVRDGRDIDTQTTKGDYSADVMLRAEVFAEAFGEVTL